jgi:hypothetical protein
LRNSSYIGKLFLIYDIAPDPISISLYVYEEIFLYQYTLVKSFLTKNRKIHPSALSFQYPGEQVPLQGYMANGYIYLPAKKAACVFIHAILILRSIVSSDPRQKNSQSLIVKFRYNPHRFPLVFVQGRELCGQPVAKAFNMVWDPGQRSSGRDSTLIKKKIKFSSYIRKF